MNIIAKLILSFFAAVIAPFCILLLLTKSLAGSFVLSFFLSFFGSIYALIFGIPIFLVLLWFNYIKWWLSLIVGFFVVSLSDITTIFQYWETMNSYGYLFSQIKGVITNGILGAIGGFTFWFVWIKLNTPNTPFNSQGGACLDRAKTARPINFNVTQ